MTSQISVDANRFFSHAVVDRILGFRSLPDFDRLGA
jgi:hypothetical protein